MDPFEEIINGFIVLKDSDGIPLPCAAEACPYDPTDFSDGVILKAITTQTRPFPQSSNPTYEISPKTQYHRKCAERLGIQ